MSRLLGLDTEYGIAVEGADVGDLADEARALVQHWPGPWAGPWDDSREHPLRDLRGFRAERLHTDPEDDRFERAPERALPRSEARADRVLANGARLYQDHGHPEYATPECLSLTDLVAHDRAGERAVWTCARRYAAATGKRVRLYKNNVDFHGMSYGAHENYLLRRDLPFERLYRGLLPFLVTRILFAGAGKVTSGGLLHKTAHYELSQRASFFSEICSVDTLHRRPIFNTRDEPHADPGRHRRLHVIAGDANLCEVATALKVGTTALVLDLLEGGWSPEFGLSQPVQAIQALSRDRLAPLTRDTGGTVGGLDVQAGYLAAARARLAGRDAQTDWVLAEWADALDALQSRPERLRDRLDWVAKRELLMEFLAAEGLSWSKADPELLQSLDLAYHDLDPEAGLGQGLRQHGEVRALVDEQQIAAALERGPADTRAFARGWCAAHLAPQIRAISWSRIVFEHAGQTVELDLRDAVDEAAARALNAQVQAPGALLDALAARAGGPEPPR